jgi:hypothetical protein
LDANINRHIRSSSFDFDLTLVRPLNYPKISTSDSKSHVQEELMKLDMSDFRTSLNLGHLRNATEKLDEFFTDGGRRSTSVFSCRGHHHDPVFDYTGMVGAYPMLVTFPYLALPSPETTPESTSSSLPFSIAKILFGTSVTDKADSQAPPTRTGPVNEHLDLIVPTFWAFIADPCT